MSTYAIGDIHGCLTALKTLFEQQTFGAEDTIVLLGDYVDKGPDSAGVIDYLLDLDVAAKCIYLKGNHELLMCSATEGGRLYDNWMTYGGKETRASYDALETDEWVGLIPDRHWEFIKAGQLYFETEECIYVHAGVDADKDIEEQSVAELCWRKYQIPHAHHSGKRVICGHTARKSGEIAHFGHATCIDTYAYGGMWLTCLEVESGDYLQTNEDGEYQRGHVDALRAGRGSRGMSPL